MEMDKDKYPNDHIEEISPNYYVIGYMHLCYMHYVNVVAIEKNEPDNNKIYIGAKLYETGESVNKLIDHATLFKSEKDVLLTLDYIKEFYVTSDLHDVDKLTDDIVQDEIKESGLNLINRMKVYKLTPTIV